MSIIGVYRQSELQKVEDAYAEIEQIRDGQDDEQAACGHLAKGGPREGD
jgi:hypothetical protein